MKRKKIYIWKIVLQEAAVTVLVLTSIIVVSCFEMLLCLQVFKQMKHNTMHAKRSEKSVNVREWTLLSPAVHNKLKMKIWTRGLRWH